MNRYELNQFVIIEKYDCLDWQGRQEGLEQQIALLKTLYALEAQLQALKH